MRGFRVLPCCAGWRTPTPRKESDRITRCVDGQSATRPASISAAYMVTTHVCLWGCSHWNTDREIESYHPWARKYARCTEVRLTSDSNHRDYGRLFIHDNEHTLVSALANGIITFTPTTNAAYSLTALFRSLGVQHRDLAASCAFSAVGEGKQIGLSLLYLEKAMMRDSWLYTSRIPNYGGIPYASKGKFNFGNIPCGLLTARGWEVSWAHDGLRKPGDLPVVAYTSHFGNQSSGDPEGLL